MTDGSRTARILYAGRYLEFAERSGWEMVLRRHPVVALMAWTPGDEMLLVEQYRIPVGKRTIELPAGLAGDSAEHSQESLLDAAGRELEEETGWRAGRLEFVMACPSSAGLSDETISFVAAHDLVKTGPGGGDDSEDIRVHAISSDTIDNWLAGRHEAGLGIDSKIYTALYLRSRWR